MIEEYKKKAERAELVALCALGLVFGMLCSLAVCKAYQSGREAERAEFESAEQLRQAQAQAYEEGAEWGNADGWRACIEENNLYERYY